MVYPWKAETSYGFLTRAEPLETDGTTYTSWFHDPNSGVDSGWRLIASWTRPKVQTYLKGFNSFIECFETSYGNLTRMAYYGRQWAYDKTSGWKESSTMKISKDSTATNNQRRDIDGGVVGELRSHYYLVNGGFINTTASQGTLFTRQPSGVAPDVDFESLNAMLL